MWRFLESLKMSEEWAMEEHTIEEKTMMTNEKEPMSCRQRFKKGLKDNLFTILTLIGVIIGFGIGFGVGKTRPSQVAITWIREFIPFLFISSS